MYVEDLKRGANKDIGPKDIFEMGSNLHLGGLHSQIGYDTSSEFTYIGGFK